MSLIDVSSKRRRHRARPSEQVVLVADDHIARSVETVYLCSDGRYRTGWQVDRHLTFGHWRDCMREPATDTWFVEREDGCLLSLSSVSVTSLPDWIELRSNGLGVWIADRRRTTPVGRHVSRRTLEDRSQG